MDRRREPLPTRVDDTPPLPAAYHATLRRVLDELGLELAPDALRRIEIHVRLLLAWTTSINLTAIREPADVALGHVGDSLSALRLIRELGPRRLLDLGSGGGFPGLPLAAALPATDPADVTVLEPIAKKARFLSAVVGGAGLTGRVQVDDRRAEDVGRSAEGRGTWDVVTARAVGSTADLVELAFPLLRPGGTLIAWKRGDLTAELAAARRAVHALGGGRLDVAEITVKGLDGHRLVTARRLEDGLDPVGYPRDPNHRRRRPW